MLVKCGGPYECANDIGQQQIHDGITTMLETIKTDVPHHVCNGWKLQKFHDLFHVSRDMYQFGSPLNWDASPGEHNLIDLAKRPARRTQKRHATFTMQVTQCLQETAALTKATNLIQLQGCCNNPCVQPNQNDTGIIGNPYATILYENGNVEFVFRSTSGKYNYFHPVIRKWFENELSNETFPFYECPLIKVSYEYKRNDILYRAHPNYQSMSQWYEWVMVTFGPENNNVTVPQMPDNGDAPYFNEHEYPSKVFCFSKQCWIQKSMH